MSREDIQKLLGGYATGTLTPEERDALFAAAIDDQELFDVLMREEPLRELLQEPVANNRLRAALTVPSRAPWYHQWLRPAALAAAAAGIVAIGIVMVEQHRPQRPVEIAKVEPVPPPAVVLPAPQPPPSGEVPRPSLAKAVARRQEAPTPPETPQAKDVELRAAQPEVTQALKQAAAEEKAEPKAGPAPLPAAPPVDVQAGLQMRPVAGLGAAGARAGVGGAVYDLRDARALFSEPGAVAPTFRSNLVRTESRGPARADTVSAPVADAVLAPAAHLGLRYTVWQRPPGGMFEQVSPEAGLNVGDEVELQLQANDLGYLYVLERGADGTWNPLATDRLSRMAVYTVPQSGALRPDGSGALDLFVLLSRRPLSEQERQPFSPVDQQVTTNPAERATYVANTASAPATQRIGFPITLRVQSH